MKEQKLRVFSIFRSIQGESSRAGLPCGFVRLAGCPLRCVYCDTLQARSAPGDRMTVAEVLKAVNQLNIPLVEVTGGEPLAQKETGPLLKALCDAGYQVLLETSGAFDILEIDPRVKIVMDMKTPGSGACELMKLENLRAFETSLHELKFAITSKDDFEWATELVRREDLIGKCELLISPVSGMVSPDEAAEWILDSGLELRLQLQLHKIIWPNAEEER